MGADAGGGGGGGAAGGGDFGAMMSSMMSALGGGGGGARGGAGVAQRRRARVVAEAPWEDELTPEDAARWASVIAADEAAMDAAAAQPAPPLSAAYAYGTHA